MVYLGLNAVYLPTTGASGKNLVWGLKNYSTLKVITYSDSTQKLCRIFFYDFILKLVSKVAQTFPKSYQFLFIMQTGKCHPYNAGYIPQSPILGKFS